MSKPEPHAEDSLAKEQLGYRLAATLLEVQGFRDVTAIRKGPMKFLDATCADGASLRFWVKDGWPYKPYVTAIQFSAPGGSARETTDEAFLAATHRNVNKAQDAGATHLLMVQAGEGALWNCCTLPIQSVYEAYAEQLKGWPKRGRNGGLPTLYFVDDREHLEAARCVVSVRAREVGLGRLALGECAELPTGEEPEGGDGKTFAQREVAVRMLQQLFRQRVKQAYEGRCAITGCTVDKVLEAAHLPGRNWREHNRAEDGVFLRVDLHRLLDSGLARLEEGVFWLDDTILQTEYGQYHGVAIPRLVRTA